MRSLDNKQGAMGLWCYKYNTKVVRGAQCAEEGGTLLRNRKLKLRRLQRGLKMILILFIFSTFAVHQFPQIGRPKSVVNALIEIRYSLDGRTMAFDGC